MPPDPEKIARLLRNALLKRGFPCYQDYLSIYLAPGLMDEDYMELKRLIRPHALPNRIHGPVDGQPVIRIQDHNRETLFKLQCISAELLLHRFPHVLRKTRQISYMTGPDGWGYKGSTLAGFLTTKFGARVPIRQLEHGIALLVKICPWYGIRTSMSCAGHPTSDGGHSAPRLFFHGHWQGAWCQHIFQTLFNEHELSRRWKFDLGPIHPPKGNRATDPNWASAHFQACPDWTPETNRPQMEHRFICDELHQIARQLMDPDLAEDFRSKKNDWILDYNKRFVEGQSELHLEDATQTDHRIAG